MSILTDLLGEVVGEAMTDALKNGEISPSDDMSKSFIYVNIANLGGVKFIANVIAQHYDIDGDDVESYLTQLYKEGDKALHDDSETCCCD